MKIVTIGLSPYLITSKAKINSLLLRYLYLTGNSVASIVWGHNTDYFVPEESDGIQSFYYDFEYQQKKHKIPVMPFVQGSNSSSSVYDYLQSLQPDVIITIGDVRDFVFMPAIKDFMNIKWMSILLHYHDPISEEYADIIRKMDGILCTSKFGFDSVQKIYQSSIFDYKYVGSNNNIYKTGEDTKENHLRIMSCTHNTQIDCGPTIMESAIDVSRCLPNIDFELYFHCNSNDKGDHNLLNLQKKWDFDNKIIKFPEKYVSLIDGLSETEMATEFSKSDIFISIPMISGTSMSVFQALASGCFPLLGENEVNMEIASNLSDFLGSDFNKEFFIVPSISITTVGDTYLNICSKQDLVNKIINAYEIIKKNKGLKKKISEFTLRYSQSDFLEKCSEMSKLVTESSETIRLE